MKVSFSWLRAWLAEDPGTPEELAERLAARGFPIEDEVDLGAGLGDIVVGRVLEVRPHPNADRLRLCDVDGGSGVVQVVCGAPNVEADGRYPFAPVGAELPGGMTIGKAELRGETSEGMLCSESELGLGSGAEGLMVLDGGLDPGVRLVEALTLDDLRLDVEVTANRGDLLSHRGIAREAAAGGVEALRTPEIPGVGDVSDGLASLETAFGAGRADGAGVSIAIEDPDLCWRYLGLVVRGVEVGPSPPWLRSRLRAIGARPINSVVDATNYVLHELGQPLHAFDLARIAGGRVIVRRAKPGESIRTLDGVSRDLRPDMLAICDENAPIAVAGVMGGADSEVSTTTTDLLIECALFAPPSVRSTRKALGLSTDASYRFERGVDPELQREALLRTAQIILATAGGEAPGPVIDVCPRPFERPRLLLRVGRVERLLGIPVESEAIPTLLAPLGFTTEAAEDGFEVTVPGFRTYDVTREVDLIEEVARAIGYDAFPDDLRAFRPGTVPDHPLFDLEDELRDVMVGEGFLEAQTPAFSKVGAVRLLNPMSAEEAFLRSELLPALIRRLEHNLNRGNRDVRLFELGTVFGNAEPGELPREETRIAAIIHGSRHPRHWSDGAEAVDKWEVKGLLERLARCVALDGWKFVSASNDVSPPSSVLEPGAFVLTSAGGTPVGAAGRLDEEAVDLPAWASDAWGLELVLPPDGVAREHRRFTPIPFHPSADRDLALLVPASQAVGEVIALIGRTGRPVLEDVEVFDLYEGDGLRPGVRSVTVRLRFRSSDRTLTDEEVDTAVDMVTRMLQEEMGVELRGQGG